ncbi:f-box domain-containing protein [Lentinula edodes]|uniref:F-box domain-containing protein n=1 Tax=Lentinula edodes TaxID=5353 RepID=A0A1Q3E2B4_LENED|nr:f-box domain-containing protein [Lentinula edodes]
MTTASEPVVNLLSFPPEIIHHILVFCQPTDVATFAKTLVVDEASAEPFNWKDVLQRRTEAELIARRAQNVESHERRRALETFVTAALQALPAIKNSEEKEQPSSNLQWLDRVLRETHMLSQPILQTDSDSETIQLRSRLRAYVSLTHDPSDEEESTKVVAARRIESRCFVYDIRNYKPITHWGPFLANGFVNWQHIEHLGNVVLTNLRELPGSWATTVPSLGLENTQAFSAPGPCSDIDWAGVEGTWRRYVCFMDYRDLFAFNYSNVAHGPRNAEFFRDSRFREATRLIEIKLYLVSRSQLRFYTPSPDLEDLKTRYPTLFFCGVSRGVSGNEAKVEGNVCIGIDGTIRWTFYDLIQGAVHDLSTLWCSKGVQLGGIASAAGIVGSWGTSVHDQGDPVGPFWLWKVPPAHSGALMDFT